MRWTIPAIPRPHAEHVLRGRAYLPESVTLRRTVWKTVIGQGGFVVHLSRRTGRGTMVWESVAVLRAAVDTTSDRGTVVLTAYRLAWCVLPGLAGLGLLGFAGAVGVTVARDHGAAFWQQACVGAIGLAILGAGGVVLAATLRTVGMVLAEVAALRRGLVERQGGGDCA